MRRGTSRRICHALALVVALLAMACEREPQSAQTETGVNADAAERLRDADAARRDLAAKIGLRLTGDDKERFIEAENAWLAYRDADCDAAKGLHAGDSMESLIEATCLLELSNQRRAVLERTYREQLGRD